MENFNEYEIAKLDEKQIAMINNTQQSIEQNTDDRIVLIAYRKKAL